MLRRLKLFFQKNFISTFRIKMGHIFALSASVFVLSQPIFSEINKNLIANYFQDLVFKNGYPVLFVLSGLAALCFLSFNLSTIVRNLFFDLLSIIFSVVTVNAIGYSMMITEFSSWPFLQANILMVLNSLFLFTGRLNLLERENKLIQKAFKKYVNKDLLDNLMANPKQLSLLGEQKEVTVFFSDIRNFTNLAESLGAKELVNFTNTYLENMTSLIVKNEGTIDKYIGDAIMAFWNAPIDIKFHSTKAIYTGVAMLQKLNNLKKSDARFQDISIGIGIHTGKVIVGNVGSSNKIDYTVLGDTVNLASRLESLTKKYGLSLLVSETVKNAFVENPGQPIIFRLVDNIIVKGKSKSIKIYEPLLKNEFSIQIKSNYEAGFNQYSEGNFKQAYESFKSLATTGDPVSRLMCHRLSDFHPTFSWNGIWSWEEK